MEMKGKINAVQVVAGCSVAIIHVNDGPLHTPINIRQRDAVGA